MILRLNRSWIYFLINLILFVIYLIWRYIDLGYDVRLVISAAFFWGIATGLLCYANVIFKNPINPITAFSVYIFLFGYSIIPISSEQKEYSLTTYLVVFLSVISFLVPILFKIKIPEIKILVLSINQRIKLLYFLLIASCLTFLLECLNFGFIPLFEITSRDIYIETNQKLLPFLHYFIVLNSYIPCWAYLFYKKKILSKKSFYTILFISSFILLNYLSRQVYFLLGISLLIGYSYFYKIKFFSIIKVVFLVLFLFLFIGFMKFHSSVTDSFSEYMRLIANIDNVEINVLESTVVEYSSKRYTAFDMILDTRDKLGYYGAGIYTFRPLISFCLLEKTGVVTRIPELDSETLVATYAADPYLDFGFLGVILMNFFYGSLALRCYKNYIDRKSVAVVSWSIILFCCLMGMFVNYYNTMLVWLGLLLNQILFYKIEKIK